MPGIFNDGLAAAEHRRQIFWDALLQLYHEFLLIGIRYMSYRRNTENLNIQPEGVCQRSVLRQQRRDRLRISLMHSCREQDAAASEHGVVVYSTQARRAIDDDIFVAVLNPLEDELQAALAVTCAG